ncbi:hypothetical protein A3D66_03035 [Candidatus Kaiserbacteria bacterium RIFCSPHIGHO2_02_FULL_50_9]|uniref:EamA domain-containing protein n=1 Tax=Candidatus Kaiserbacteria bacterium RIFCSPLOWO2_01_FULL_51_21 TaxID=1798508 RepID=A0A1F6EE83_9BACT|nr:MAG: hypothetical protein A2761_03315 [Candidatus Kaiserbacteria bacterium RIFCSPHIGHO2_01_FULL_51_33]OGG63675.1 MAG: hypothetical protein A3D66_03035 [Candidatus Kaiserbacteria bacterium RIFCSPHIGHO2_02_FULL_50_9]OGG71979.1 MAG: hypothetical protein A3A35_01145 [Candidatus Kaiserbacteria bacterium RIFCSPLOWO2_01_FULL_51_21]
MDPITGLLLAVLAGIPNGIAWSLSSIFQRLPAAYFAGAGYIVASVVAFGWLILLEGTPAHVDPSYWLKMFLTAGLLAVAFILATAAPRVADLTLTRPMTPLTIVLMFVSGPLLVKLGEEVKWKTTNDWGDFGIAVVVTSFVLLLLVRSKLPDAPAEAKKSKSRGVGMMLVVVALYSITAYYDAILVDASSPAFYLATIFFVIGLMCLGLGALDRRFFFLHLEKGREVYEHCWSWKNIRPCVFFGVLYASATACHMVALKATGHVNYVVAIKESLSAVDAALVTWLLVHGTKKGWWWRRRDAEAEKVYVAKRNEAETLPRRVWAMLGIVAGTTILVVLGTT